MTIELFYITHPDQQAAKKITDLCVHAKLAACANIFPMESCYFWESALQQEQEYVSILKTHPDKVDELSTFIMTHHPYDVPCIIHWPVKVNPAYGKWVLECLD